MTEQSDDFALVIGVSDYPSYGIQGNNLQGAVDDARDFAAWLTDTDAGGGLPGANCEIILATPSPLQPERGAVDAALERFWNAADQAAGRRRFYFYFSGHGHAEEIDDVSLCMANWSFRRRQAALSSGEYRRLIHQCMRFGEVVIILDCCRPREIAAAGLGSELNCVRPDEEAGASRTFIAYATEFQQAAFGHQGGGERIRGRLTAAPLRAARQRQQRGAGLLPRLGPPLEYRRHRRRPAVREGERRRPAALHLRSRRLPRGRRRLPGSATAWSSAIATAPSCPCSGKSTPRTMPPTAGSPSPAHCPRASTGSAGWTLSAAAPSC